MDETWVHYYDPKTKEQSKEWLKKFLVKKSTGKVLASVFCDKDGINLMDYFKNNKTITRSYYTELVIILLEKIVKSRLRKFAKGVVDLNKID